MRIALINMPFANVGWASLQVGLLKSLLVREGYTADDLYLNLEFARVMTPAPYQNTISLTDILLGDWLFATKAYGPSSLQDDRNYLARHSSTIEENFRGTLPLGMNVEEWLLQLKREVVPQWIEHTLNATDWACYDVIGFSCVFMQTVASVALARKIKERHPQVKIMFGGSSVEGEMGAEIARQEPWIDCVVSGEGEALLLEVLSRWKTNEKVSAFLSSSKTTDLTALPVPDYDTYFKKIDEDPDYSFVETEFGAKIPLEFSRGCWWGAKHHCTFCGLNGSTMEFRSKSESQAINEIEIMSEKYHRYRFQMADNIMNHRFVNTLMKDLAQTKASFQFFFEVKSNLSREQLATLCEAGVHLIQPGIESLHSEVLKLMKKGVSGAQNIQLLRWAQELGMDVAWNVLYGFPFEKEEWYREINRVTPLLVHLQPPGGAYLARMDRFSPFFNDAGKEIQAFRDVGPSPDYQYVYPARYDHRNLAYFYQSKANTFVEETTYAELRENVERWKAHWSEKRRRPELLFYRGVHSGHVVDRRFDIERVFRLNEDHFQVASFLHSHSASRVHLVRELNLPEIQISAVLEELIEAKLVLAWDDQYVWLPVQVGRRFNLAALATN